MVWFVNVYMNQLRMNGLGTMTTIREARVSFYHFEYLGLCGKRGFIKWDCEHLSNRVDVFNLNHTGISSDSLNIMHCYKTTA